VFVDQSTFQGNGLTDEEADEAGAISVADGTLVVQSSTFLGNRASGRDTGALTAKGQGKVTINESRFAATGPSLAVLFTHFNRRV
jgi:hypothetical protein